MVSTQRGLGRGLDALFKNGLEQQEETGDARAVQTVPLASLSANPAQPRRNFAEQPLEELAASIKNQGVLQPILVRPIAGQPPLRYEIVAGERRWRAARKAGLAEVPVIVRNLTDQETLILALVENLQREDLNPMEEARGLARLKEEFGLSQEDLAGRVNKSRSAIANSMRLLTLPEAVQEDISLGRLTAGHARALLTVSEAGAQDLLRQRVIRERLSVREAEALASAWKESGAGSTTAPGARRERSSLAEQGAGQGAVSGGGERLGSLREELSRCLALPVSLSGNENKGRISVRFSSAEELRRLLAVFGLETQ